MVTIQANHRQVNQVCTTGLAVFIKMQQVTLNSTWLSMQLQLDGPADEKKNDKQERLMEWGKAGSAPQFPLLRMLPQRR
jgi:hypothetical protein